jgi:hypothetical protein
MGCFASSEKLTPAQMQEKQRQIMLDRQKDFEKKRQLQGGAMPQPQIPAGMPLSKFSQGLVPSASPSPDLPAPKASPSPKASPKAKASPSPKSSPSPALPDRKVIKASTSG